MLSKVSSLALWRCSLWPGTVQDSLWLDSSLQQRPKLTNFIKDHLAKNTMEYKLFLQYLILEYFKVEQKPNVMPTWGNSGCPKVVIITKEVDQSIQWSNLKTLLSFVSHPKSWVTCRQPYLTLEFLDSLLECSYSDTGMERGKGMREKKEKKHSPNPNLAKSELHVGFCCQLYSFHFTEALPCLASWEKNCID